jgi:hypothetical protein
MARAVQRRFTVQRPAVPASPARRVPAWLKAFRAALAATPERDPAPRFARPPR